MCQPVQILRIIFLQHPGLTKTLNNEATLATITNLRGLITVTVKVNAMLGVILVLQSLRLKHCSILLINCVAYM